MTDKINIWDIFKHHFDTFKDEKGNRSNGDWVIMFLFPLITAFLICYFFDSISSNAYTNIVTAGAIFTGLLLNLLVLVYDQKTKLLSMNITAESSDYIKYAIRKRVIDEVQHNISYCIVMCLLTVVFSVIASTGFTFSILIPKTSILFNLRLWFIDFILIFICIHIILVILMILKRVHKLMSTH